MSIRYRSCSFDGSRAAAVLAFRESVSAASSAVREELNKLNDLSAQQDDEEIILVDDASQELKRREINDSLVLRSKTESQGIIYRRNPVIDAPTDSNPQARGALVGTAESSIAQWMFQRFDGTPDSATYSLVDSSFFEKTAFITGSAPSVDDGGPLGHSRSFDGSTYFTVPTKKAILDISNSMMLMRGDVASWAWIKPASDTERVICSFSSPATNPAAFLAGTATVTQGSASVAVTSAAGLAPLKRIVFGSQSDRPYEVQSVVGTTVTLTETYKGSNATGVSMTLALDLDAVPAIIAPPEQRNTLYAMSVRRNTLTNKIEARAYWQHKGRETVEAKNDLVDWPSDQYMFVGFQRQARTLDGTISWIGSFFLTLPGYPTIINISGNGTKFLTEFGGGVLSGNRYIQIGTDKKNYRVSSVDSDTSMWIEAPTTLTAFVDSVYTSQRTTVSVGLLDGTWSSSITDHLPSPTGGLEVKSSMTNEALADFHVGCDMQYVSDRTFIGSMNCLSMYAQPVDLRFMYSRAFPDYVVVDSSSIKRSIVSDIVSGSTSYASYQYSTSMQKTLSTSSEASASTDIMIAGLENPNVANTTQLAQAIGAPDPAVQSNQDVIDQQMSNFGILAVNGQSFIKGRSDVSAYASLAQTVGGIKAADALIVGKPAKSFAFVALVEETSESTSIDSCGVPVPVVKITEKIVGINKTLRESAYAAGYSDPSRLKIKFWWIQSVGIDAGTIIRLKNFGFTESQISNVTSLTSTENLTVQVIPFTSITSSLNSSGVSSDDIDALMMRPSDIMPIDLNPNVDKTALAIQEAIMSPVGNTIDGDTNTTNPALLVSGSIDLGKSLKSNTEDLFPDLNDLDEDCRSIVICVDDMMKNVSDAVSYLNNFVIKPFALPLNAQIGIQKLAFSKYIPCVANVSGAFGLPPFQTSMVNYLESTKLLLSQVKSIEKQAEKAAKKFDNMLCIPRVFLAALKGGVCGIESPQVISKRSCPSQLDLSLDRLESLIKTAELLLRKVFDAIYGFRVELELSIGAASSILLDSQIPCIAPVSVLLNNFTNRLFPSMTARWSGSEAD